MILHKELVFTPTINKAEMPYGYPLFMCVPTFGCLLFDGDHKESPLSRDESDIMTNAVLYHQFLFDRVNNSKKREHRVKFDDLRLYVPLQASSTFRLAQQKTTDLLDLGMIEVHRNGYRVPPLMLALLKEAADKWHSVQLQ